MAPIEGYWGRPTATIDWCEENYVVSYYIAEFWNTISNLVMIIPPLGGFYYAYKNKLEPSIMLCFLSLAIVGCGSWAFHMTLLYEMQLFDEMPMLWGSLILVYSLMTYYYEIYERDHRYNLMLKLALCSYGLVSTIIYLSFKTPILFQASYAILVTWVLSLDICLLKYKPCSKKVFFFATAFHYTAFILWLIDNFFCNQLRATRQTYYLLNPFTQLHAWWHLLAGYGAYLHIIFCAHSRGLALNSQLRLKYVWFIGVVLDREEDGGEEPSKVKSK